MDRRDFELLRDEEIPELNTRALLYRHRTGCEIVSLINDDENKVFGINFRTPPADSTGIAHILEHSVLCGSRKYPVKEPFVELIKGSLNTFLNAFTYPDKTCYPVASTNLQDFYNLIDVYLDAVFYPRLTPEVLQQEGWHYELADPGDPLRYKGVVFNEMKGAYSDPERILGERTQQSIFPDTTYGVDSGGDPRDIPALSFDQFKRFHDDFYHPSNARIYFYGDDDPQQRLALLHDYLSDYEAHSVDSTIGTQPRFTAPKQQQFPYAVDPDAVEEPKCFVVLTWLLQDEIDADERRALQVLEHALLGTPGSPLRKALIDSGLGEDLTGSGLEIELAQMFFSVGLKGVQQGDADAVEALILQHLGDLADGGIDQGMVAAALHTAEFRFRENNTGSFPRGLGLMLRLLTDWLYDRDPFTPLRFADSFAALKAKLAADDRYLEELIQRHLLDNAHRTTVVLQPDAELGTRLEEEETSRLAEARAGMNHAELEELVAATQKLKHLQEQPDAPEDLAKLPRLQLSDLDAAIKTVPRQEDQIAGVPVLHHDLFTNGIAYLDVGCDLRVLPQKLLPYIPLFGRALLEMGTKRMNFVELHQRIGSQTGGLNAHSLVGPRPDGGPAATYLFLRGKAMVERVSDLTAIMRDVLLEGRLDDRERFLQMALEERASAEGGLVPGGHRVVSTRLRAQFDETGWLAEQMRGLSYLFFLRQLIEDIRRDWPAVQARLEQIRALLVNRPGMLCNATSDDRAACDQSLAELLQRVAARGALARDVDAAPDSCRRGPDRPRASQLRGQGGQHLRTRLRIGRVVGRHHSLLGHDLALGSGAGPRGGLRVLLLLRPIYRGVHVRILPRPQLAGDAASVRPERILLARLSDQQRRADQSHHRHHRRFRLLPAPRRQGLRLADALPDWHRRRLSPANARPSLGHQSRALCGFCRGAGPSRRNGAGRSVGVGGCDCSGFGCARELADAGQSAVRM